MEETRNKATLAIGLGFALIAIITGWWWLLYGAAVAVIAWGVGQTTDHDPDHDDPHGEL